MFSPFLGILAIIFGIIALNMISKNPKNYSGKGKAIAGTVLGAILIIEAILLSLTILFVGRTGHTV